MMPSQWRAALGIPVSEENYPAIWGPGKIGPIIKFTLSTVDDLKKMNPYQAPLSRPWSLGPSSSWDYQWSSLQNGSSLRWIKARDNVKKELGRIPKLYMTIAWVRRSYLDQMQECARFGDWWASLFESHVYCGVMACNYWELSFMSYNVFSCSRKESVVKIDAASLANGHKPDCFIWPDYNLPSM